jgi:putative transposase
LQKIQTADKKKFEFLKEVPSQPLQEVFAVLSNGKVIDNPTFLKKKKQLKMAQRILSKKKKGSMNWLKQLSKVQKHHQKVANQRRAFLHKVSFSISQTYGLVFVEDLHI